MKKLLLRLLLLTPLLLIPQLAIAQMWRPVRGDILFNISGIALVNQQKETSSFLIVHDNKGKNQARLAIVTITGKEQAQYSPIDWPTNAELPSDLEGLTAVPGTSSFMALASAGKVYHIQLTGDNKTVSVLKVFDLPNIPRGSNFESFALQNIDGQLLAIWAHRGQGAESAVIYWGTLNLATYQITQQGSAKLTVPFPTGNVRHISDLKIDAAGVVFVSAATDNGDDGPFDSAVYVAGSFSDRDRLFQFRQSLTPLYHLPDHKIEGIELVPGASGGVVLGTDDENMGGSVFMSW
ncbi:hypothetical protein [Phormidium nigroviride]